MGGGHALGERSQASSGSEPVRQPGQVAVTVEVVGVQTPKMGKKKASASLLLSYSPAGLIRVPHFCR